MLASILSDFLRVRGIVFQLLEKQGIADDRRNYTMAATLFQKTLRDTTKRLENIYFQHVLMPQIGSAHTRARNITVQTVSVMVIMYITRRCPIGAPGASLCPLALEQGS